MKDDRAWRAGHKAFKAVGEARQGVLTADEMQRLLGCCPDGLREFVVAGAFTGARLGELTSAKIRDFDQKGRTLTVRGKTGCASCTSMRAPQRCSRGSRKGEARRMIALADCRRRGRDSQPHPGPWPPRSQRPGSTRPPRSMRCATPTSRTRSTQGCRSRPWPSIAAPAWHHDQQDLRQGAGRAPGPIRRHGGAYPLAQRPRGNVVAFGSSPMATRT